MRLVKTILCVCVLMLMVAACGNVAGDPAETVESYLEAKVAADADAVARLLCSDMEADLTRESTSFASVEATIEAMECTRDGDANTVTCTGAIVATYGTEDTEFPLGTYNVALEDGEWRWCGEAQ